MAIPGELSNDLILRSARKEVDIIRDPMFVFIASILGCASYLANVRP
jgi:hypothetical protein